MDFQWSYREYNRRFTKPLRTAHGTWESRKGFIIRIEGGNGKHGYGEIATLDNFGSESHADAREFLRNTGNTLSQDSIEEIPDDLPCCRFAFANAWNMASLQSEDEPSAPVRSTYLLPQGDAAIGALKEGMELGFTSFKWKIGVKPDALEFRLLRMLCESLPEDCKLRLDANASLSTEQTKGWLEQSDNYGIEYLEQPIPRRDEELLLQIALKFQTPVALDESIDSIAKLEALKYWPGPLIVKPALMGAPKELMDWRHENPEVTLIYSSVFETLIGMQSIVQIASADPSAPASGFGTQIYFPENDPLSHPSKTPLIPTDAIGIDVMDRVWETLS